MEEEGGRAGGREGGKEEGREGDGRENSVMVGRGGVEVEER